MTGTEVRELTHRAPVYTGRHRLEEVLGELERGWPALVRRGRGCELLLPGAAAGHYSTRRLVDLPLEAPRPLPGNANLPEAIASMEQDRATFAPVEVGDDVIGVVARETLLARLLADGDGGALSVHQQEIARAIDLIPDGVVMLGEDRRVTMTNPAGAELLQLLEVDLERPVTRLGDTAMETLALGGADGTSRDIYLRVDGSKHVISVRVLLPNSPTARDTLLLMRDVTELRDRQRQTAWQERMVVLGQLAGGIAHDFNNLLTVITGHATLLRRWLPEHKKASDSAAAIQTTTERASALVRQLLAFGRSEVTQPAPIDLPTMLRNLEGMLVRLVGDQVDLELDVDDALWPISAEVTQIERVLANLIVNAREAMPDGGRLLVRATNVERVGGVHQVKLVVEDNGLGMEPKVMSRIFDPYFTTRTGEGTGLGLATVHGTVEQLGGSIEVWSRPGQGSRFEILLPAVSAIASTGEAPGAVRRIVLAGVEVLLVEDQAAVAEVTQALLRAEGCSVRVARNMGHALDLVDRHGLPEVVVTDIVMPGGSGIDLLVALRERDPKLRAVLVTGHTGAEELERAQELGLPVLAKPFTADQMRAAIADVIGLT